MTDVVLCTRWYGRPSKTKGLVSSCAWTQSTMTFLLLLGRSTYSTSTGAGGSKRSSIAAISRRVLSETFWPTIFPSSATPMTTLPPWPLRKAQSVLPAAPSCAVERFSSSVSDSPAAIW